MPPKKAFFAKKEKTEDKVKGSHKRKRSDKSTINDAKNKRSKFEAEEITSESENEEVIEEVESEESDHETAIEKRNRLAKQMLEGIREKVSQDDDEVKSYLKSQVLESSGRLFHKTADEYIRPTLEDVRLCTWSGLGVVTCVVVSSDNKFIFSGCKSGHIIKWSLPDCKKLSIIKRIKKNEEGAVGHHTDVKCLALTKDGKYLASGGTEEFVYIWDAETMTHFHTFKGHRSSVTSLCFQVGSHMLYSGSKDKSIKRWNVDEKAYAETLFGHEDSVMSLDSLTTERIVSCGGRDNSIRFWKIPEESHLLFGGGLNNIDCVKFFDHLHFLSASCDNKLAIWSTNSKKHRVVVNDAHGNTEQWISSIATLKQHDIAVSGSHDGQVRFWKVSEDYKSLDMLFSIQLGGYVNSLQFSDDGQYVVAGIGKEHKLGRWFESMKFVRNSVTIIKMKSTVANGDV